MENIKKHRRIFHDETITNATKKTSGWNFYSIFKALIRYFVDIYRSRSLKFNNFLLAKRKSFFSSECQDLILIDSARFFHSCSPFLSILSSTLILQHHHSYTITPDCCKARRNNSRAWNNRKTSQRKDTIPKREK